MKRSLFVLLLKEVSNLFFTFLKKISDYEAKHMYTTFNLSCLGYKLSSGSTSNNGRLSQGVKWLLFIIQEPRLRGFGHP